MTINRNKKHLKLLLAIGLLLLVTTSTVILLRNPGPPRSKLIDKIAADTGAQCQAYARTNRYATVYGLCHLGKLPFRVDDLSGASEQQTARLRAAMSIGCYSQFDGSISKIINITGEDLVISAYFLADYNEYPDLEPLRAQLTSAGHQLVLSDTCASADSNTAASVRLTPLAWSALSQPAEKLAAAGRPCAQESFKLTLFGITAAKCTADILIFDLSDATQPLADALADGADYLASCPTDLRLELLRFKGEVYALVGRSSAQELQTRLAQAGSHTELVAVCIGTSSRPAG